MFTALQPHEVCTTPASSDDTAAVPKTKKSLNPCTMAFFCRAISFYDHSCSGNKHEVPAHSQQDQRRPVIKTSVPARLIAMHKTFSKIPVNIMGTDHNDGLENL